MPIKSVLYYIHDPMCSWCWGFSSALNNLLTSLPKEVEVQRILGGLAPDTDIPMPKDMQEYVKSNWSRIENTVYGVKFNFDFWNENIPRRSTYPSCRAVIAAKEQGKKYDVLMTKAIQNAYYKEARNPSDNSTLVELASELNLSLPKFKQDFFSEETQKKLIKEINFSRELFVESFPTLVLKVGERTYSILLDYNNSELMLGEIHKILMDEKN